MNDPATRAEIAYRIECVYRDADTIDRLAAFARRWRDRLKKSAARRKAARDARKLPRRT